MKNDMSNLLKSIETDLDELQALTKSFMDSNMAKAEGELPEEEASETPEFEANESPEYESMEGEMPAEEGMEPGMEGAGTDEAELAAYAASLPDEVLEQVIEIMISEMESRSGAEGMEGEMDKALPVEGAGQMPPAEEGAVMDPAMDQGAEGPLSVEAVQQDLASLPEEELAVLAEALANVLSAKEQPEAAPAAAPAPAAPAMKSVSVAGKTAAVAKEPKEKPEASNLTKLTKSLDDLNARMAKIEKAAKAAKAPAETIANTKYADPKVKVLEKSVNEGVKMDHMELANWLLAQQRTGNKLVKSMHVARANVSSNPEELSKLYADLKGLGVVPPPKA